jgi:hypothetical protein
MIVRIGEVESWHAPRNGVNRPEEVITSSAEVVLEGVPCEGRTADIAICSTEEDEEKGL